MNQKKLDNEKGQGMTEYIVIIGIIVVLLLIFKSQFQPAVSTAVSSITNQLNSAIQP